MGCRASLEKLEKRKISYPCRNSNTGPSIGQPTHSSSSYLAIRRAESVLRNYSHCDSHEIPHILHKQAEALVVATRETGLEVSADKTKYMVMSRDYNEFTG